MNITSYNVTDVGYHYIGMRVLGGLPSGVTREEQTGTISRNVRKYVSDKALRLVLPEPRGTFETSGKKICQELVHMQLAQSLRGAYVLSEGGKEALALLNDRKTGELRRVMVKAHLRTYDNLRLVVKKHLDLEAIWRPVVNADRLADKEYIVCLLAPTLGPDAELTATQLISEMERSTPKKLEDSLGEVVLRAALPEMKIGVPMFRAMCDRLVSLRLLNQNREYREGCEFLKTYTPCVAGSPPKSWYVPLEVRLNSGNNFPIALCEPDMTSKETLEPLLGAIYKAFRVLTPTAGYYDLPELRDTVSEELKIPQAAFDDGLNGILDRDPRPLTIGRQTEGTTGRRKPLVRDRGGTQIYNLIRKA